MDIGCDRKCFPIIFDPVEENEIYRWGTNEKLNPFIENTNIWEVYHVTENKIEHKKEKRKI